MEYHDLLSIPFGYGGRDLSSGFLDCYGVVVEMSKRNGKILPERSISEDHMLIHALMAAQISTWKKIPNPVAGSIVLLKIRRVPCHIGYMINEFEFIHAWEGTGGAVVERLSEWERRVEGFYEYVG